MPVIVGLTCSLHENNAKVRMTYVDAVIRAGGVPILLPPPRATDSQRESVSSADAAAALLRVARAHLDLCDAIVLTGGPDARTERHGHPTHPAASPVHPDRQRYEEALLAAIDERRSMPTLGICLGMQLMALHAGGELNQHLPDDTPTHAEHTADNHHRITPVKGTPLESLFSNSSGGCVASHHHQAVKSPGRLRVVARAHDGVIEAIDDPARPFYLGVQWHPERTSDEALGVEVFRRLIAAAHQEPRIH